MMEKEPKFYNNSVVYADHFQQIINYINDKVKYDFTQIKKHYYGIETLILDPAEFNNGNIIIHEVKGVFSNGVVFNYNSQKNGYGLSFDLEKISHILQSKNKIKLYLTMSNEREDSSTEIINECSEKILLNFQTTKIMITEQISQNQIPFLEIINKGTNYEKTDFEPPSLLIKKTSNIGKKLHNLILFFKKNLINLKEQIAIEQFQQQERNFMCKILSECVVDLNALFINEQNSFELYKGLCSVLGKISWNNSMIPNIPPYNHDNSYEILKILINDILGILDTSKSVYNSQNFSLVEDKFKTPIPQGFIENLMLIISPNSEGVLKWVTSTTIGTEQNFDNLRMIRSPGISRTIVNRDNNEIIISLNQFDTSIQPGVELWVLNNPELNIKNIKLYFNLNDASKIL